eukprot:gene6165-7138_t
MVDKDKDILNPNVDVSPKTPNDLPDKFNYASADCGATVLNSNSEAKDQWFVFELCEEIGIQIVEMANYEYFSSMFKDFVVMGTNRYPSNSWHFLGNFTGSNVRKPQYFVLKEKSWYNNPQQPKISKAKDETKQTWASLKNVSISFTADKTQSFSIGEPISNQPQSSTQSSPPTGGTETTEDPINFNDSEQPQKNPQSILKTLADRVKSVEINQSISIRYLEQLEAHYSGLFQIMREDFSKILVFFNGIADLGLDLERRVALERQETEKKISQDFSREITYLRERIYRLEQRNEDDKTYYHVFPTPTLASSGSLTPSFLNGSGSILFGSSSNPFNPFNPFSSSPSLFKTTDANLSPPVVSTGANEQLYKSKKKKKKQL